jgi:hypothetical protein
MRWGARLLSAGILLFWGGFIIAHLFGEGERSSRPPVMSDYIGLTAMGIALLGLAVAWKWELIGAVMALGGYGILALVNADVLVLTGPYILWPIAAVLFLSSWWMHRAAQRDTATMRPTG